MPLPAPILIWGRGEACEILYKLASIGFVLVSAKVTFPRSAGSSFSSGRSGKAVHQKPLSYAAQLAVTVPTASIERRACSVVSPLAEKITRRADIYKWFSERNRACGARSHHSLPQPFLPPSLPSIARYGASLQLIVHVATHRSARSTPRHASKRMLPDSEMRFIAVQPSCQRLKVNGGEIIIPKIPSSED
jgi:hypothetical protein